MVRDTVSVCENQIMKLKGVLGVAQHSLNFVNFIFLIFKGLGKTNFHYVVLKLKSKINTMKQNIGKYKL